MAAHRSILVVDDDRLVLGSVAAALEAAGFRVWTTDSAEEAVRLATRLQPDVVVTDLRMPGRDGMTLLEQLKRGADQVPRMVIYSATPPADVEERRMREVLWISKASGHAALLDALREG